MSSLAIGSLFSGYGGLDMGVAAALPGAEVAWHAEIEPAACRLLDHRFPGVPNLGDISRIDWSTAPHTDVLTGGFPCQDLSLAGRRLGLRPDTRSGLWEHMAYAVDQLRPALVVIENVRGLLSARAHRDLGPDGEGLEDPGVLRALGAVLGDLADLGYDAAWRGLRAADVGAPHGRFRVFVLAWPAGDAPRLELEGTDQPADRGGRAGVPDRGPDLHPAADPRGEARVLRPGLRPGGPGGLRRARPDHGDAPAPDAGGDRRVEFPSAHGDHGPLASGDVADRRPGAAVGGAGAAAAADPAGDGRAEGLTEPARLERGPDVALGRPDAGRWGVYAAAIARWELLLGRPAPDPVERRIRGGRGLSPAFVEWTMGLPTGWVTAVPAPPADQLDLFTPDLLTPEERLSATVNEQLKMLGNGVVPQQAAAAVAHLVRFAPTGVLDRLGFGDAAAA